MQAVDVIQTVVSEILSAAVEQSLSNDRVEVDATGHDDVNGKWKYKRRKMGKTKCV